MSAFQARPPVQLVLSEGAGTTAVPAPWIGHLLALGARVSRYEAKRGGRQLVAVISVPRRDFAAALIGCGWVMARPAPELVPPLELMRKMESGTPIRVVTDQYVITDHFRRLDENVTPARMYLGHGLFIAEKVNAMAVLPGLETACVPIGRHSEASGLWPGSRRRGTHDWPLRLPTSPLSERWPGYATTLTLSSPARATRTQRRPASQTCC